MTLVISKQGAASHNCTHKAASYNKHTWYAWRDGGGVDSGAQLCDGATAEDHAEHGSGECYTYAQECPGALTLAD